MLTHITVFDLGSNKLTKAIPTELGNLKALVDSFDLTGNSLTASIPTELGRLEAMQKGIRLVLGSGLGLGLVHIKSTRLDAGGDGSRGRGARGWTRDWNILGVILSLTTATSTTSTHSLEANSLTSAIATELGNLVKVSEFFSVASNSLDSAIPTELGRMTDLTADFRLFSNNLCDSVPTEITALSAGVATGWEVADGNALLGSVCPTPEPSSAPTIFTTAPTAMPTEACEPGSYLEAGSGCRRCPAGTYSSAAGAVNQSSCTGGYAPWPSSTANRVLYLYHPEGNRCHCIIVLPYHLTTSPTSRRSSM